MVIFFYWKEVIQIATTGIWKIDKRLNNVIDYTMNIEKTVNSEYGKETYRSSDRGREE